MRRLSGDGLYPQIPRLRMKEYVRKKFRGTKPFKRFHSVNILPTLQIAARANSMCWPGSCGQAQSHGHLPSGGNEGYWTPSFHLPCNSFHFLKAGEHHLPPAPINLLEGSQPGLTVSNARQQRRTHALCFPICQILLVLMEL